jgi:hypothetical protein
VILSIASVYAACVLTYRYVHGAGPRAVVGAAVSFFAVFLVCAITEPRAP